MAPEKSATDGVGAPASALDIVEEKVDAAKEQVEAAKEMAMAALAKVAGGVEGRSSILDGDSKRKKELKKLAKEARKAHQGVRDPHGVRLGMCSPLADLVHAGIGVTLYFHDTYQCFLLFLLMSVVALAPASFEPWGDFPRDDFAPESDWMLGQSVSLFRWCVGFGVGLWFISFNRAMQKRNMLRSDERVDTSADYAVEVTGYPKDTTREELREFFRLYHGEVDHLEMAVQCAQWVTLRGRWNKLKVALDDSHHRQLRPQIQSIIKRRMIHIEKRMRRLESDPKQMGVAFVVFYSQVAAAKAVVGHEMGFFTLLKWSLGCNIKVPLFRKKHRLKVVPAPEPSDVYCAWGGSHASPSPCGP